MAHFPYKQYAINVLNEITKDSDKYIVSKFIGEFKRLTKLKRYTNYEFGWVNPPAKIGAETYAIAYNDRKIIKVRVYQITIHNRGFDIWIENIDNTRDYWKLTPKQYKESASFKTEAEAKMVKNN